MKIAAFIDCNGGLLHSESDLDSPEGVQILAHVPECINDLLEQMEVIVLDAESNDGGMDEVLRRRVGSFFQIQRCPHDGGCDCRPPKSGLFRLAERNFDVDLPRSFLISSDFNMMAAGHSVGLRACLFPMFLSSGEVCISSYVATEGLRPRPIFVGDLRDATRILVVREFREK